MHIEKSTNMPTVKTVFLYQNDQVCSRCSRCSLTFGGAGMAGEVFVNPELNTGFGSESGFGSAIVEGHVGYEFDNGAYVQAGPAFLIPDSGESEIEISARLVSAAVPSTVRSPSSRATS